MKIYEWNKLDDETLNRLCKRPGLNFDSIYRQVQPIIEAVREHGDHAVNEYTRKFDGIEPATAYVCPSSCKVHLSDDERRAIDTAIQNVERFHKAQSVGDLQVETMPGINCMKYPRPIEKVGLYVPGGTAPLPSTAIMLGVPAAVAGCKTIVIATPPDSNGGIPDSIAYIAQKIGAAGILNAGGAQAVAALAYGTETVPSVDKVLGPGNQYVTVAKMALQNSDAMTSIDMPAGPSEVLVIADRTAHPGFVAADLLSQAEHGPDSQVVLVAAEGFNIEALEEALSNQLLELPRADMIRTTLENSFTLITESVDEAISFSNRYAPEHLILNVKDAGSMTDRIHHAGSVFLGAFTPESLGDYASGTNHTLPTYGYARMYSGVSLNSFQKSITFQEASLEGLQLLGPTVEKLAEMEGLAAHGNAVRIRLDSGDSLTD